MEAIFEKILLGSIGGLVTYLLAYRQFVSQRWWEKRFNLFSEALDVLKQIERSLAIYEWAVSNGQTVSNSEKVKEAVTKYEEGLSYLHALQYKFLLIGMEDAHHKLLPLLAALRIIHPSCLSSETEEKPEDLLEIIHQSKNMVGGCSGELAFHGRANLKIEDTCKNVFCKCLDKINPLSR